MTVKDRGHFKIHGSSGVITVPSDVIRNEGFPLKDGYKVLIELEKDRLVISPLQRFEHINVLENHATLYDNKEGHQVDVYFYADGATWCEYCHKPRCEHVEYAISLPEVEEAYKRRNLRPKTTK